MSKKSITESAQINAILESNVPSDPKARQDRYELLEAVCASEEALAGLSPASLCEVTRHMLVKNARESTLVCPFWSENSTVEAALLEDLEAGLTAADRRDGNAAQKRIREAKKNRK